MDVPIPWQCLWDRIRPFCSKNGWVKSNSAMLSMVYDLVSS